MKDIPVTMDLDAVVYRAATPIIAQEGLTLSRVVEGTLRRIAHDGCIHVDHFLPSATTLEAMEELEKGEVESFASVKDFMADLMSHSEVELPTSPCCSQMERNICGEDPTVLFIGKFREYGLPVRDGGSSFILIRFCPWCSAVLPSSLRDVWFDQLAQAGIDPNGSVPAPFNDEHWYSSGASTS